MLADWLGSRSVVSELVSLARGGGGRRPSHEQLLGAGTAIGVSRILLLVAALAGLALWMASCPAAAFAQEPEDQATLQIVTVPPTAGLPIGIGDELYETDGQGVLIVDLPEGIHVLRHVAIECEKNFVGTGETEPRLMATTH